MMRYAMDEVIEFDPVSQPVEGRGFQVIPSRTPGVRFLVIEWQEEPLLLVDVPATGPVESWDHRGEPILWHEWGSEARLREGGES